MTIQTQLLSNHLNHLSPLLPNLPLPASAITFILAFTLVPAATLVLLFHNHSHRHDKKHARTLTVPDAGTQSLGSKPSPGPTSAAKHSSAPENPYAGALPPSRRDALATLLPGVTKVEPEAETDVVLRALLPLGAETGDLDRNDGKEMDGPGDKKAGLTQMTTTSPAPVPTPRYTATGISTTEIAALGHFPDYATLSGVPLPIAFPADPTAAAVLGYPAHPKPRPYRPLRWPYHQTMALSRLEPDWWLELDDVPGYRAGVAQRRALVAAHGRDVLDAMPGTATAAACVEIMEMSLAFVCARYPNWFALEGEDKRFFVNKVLNEDGQPVVVDLQESVWSVPEQGGARGRAALSVLESHIPEDFGIVLRDDNTGIYHVRAAAICSAMGWNVAMKVGRPLSNVHDPVPDYHRMRFSMDRFFSKMPTDKPIQRGSWGLETGCPLYMPPGDPHAALRERQDPDLSLNDCYLRVDWQTLRRLPLSGAIVFNFKALFTPVAEFADEPGVPALLARICREGAPHLMAYKGTWHVEHVVLPALDRWAKEQEEAGVVQKGWEPATLDDSPFFSGWQEKWRRNE